MLAAPNLMRDPQSAASLPEGARGQFLAVALLLAVLAALWAAIVAPLADWYGARADQLARRELVAQHMAQLAAALPELRRRAAGVDTAAPVPLLAGDTDAVAGAALQQLLQSLSTQTGATLASAEILPGEQLGAYRRVGVRLLISADYPVLIALIRAISASTPPLLIDDLQIQSARGFGAGAGSAMNASMVVFGFRAATHG